MFGNYTKYHLCNFSEITKSEELPSEELRALWQCTFTKDRLEEIINSWLEQSEHTENKNKESVSLCNAIELVFIFLQQNFVGPFTQCLEFSELLKEKSLEDYEPFTKLMENGEEINPNVKLGELLVMAKLILRRLREGSDKNLILEWWQMRVTCVHQQLFDELTNNLYAEFKRAAEFLVQNIDTLAEPELEALLLLEVANGYLLFHRPQIAEDLLNKLSARLNVALTLEGLLGLRTKFQQKPLPQLCLKVEQMSVDEPLPTAAETHGDMKLPKLLLLEDDTRLERIRFLDAKDNEVMTLPSILQALVLAKVRLLKRSQPKDRLADEELEPYIQTLLYQERGPLQVRQSALLLNCVQESTHRRTIERSWKQCEEAVKMLHESAYSLQERLSYGFAAFLEPKWHVQMQLCQVLVSLGMIKTALDIYLQIQAWEQVIACYTRLELRHKAAEIIRQELEKKPTVLLYCLLGDATDDPKYYETAWEFSKETSGRAQAFWGNYFYQRSQFKEAVPHFQKSVEINLLQEKIWARLGYAAIVLEDWKLASHAYLTYTHLEPYNFEAWNNLAKALINLGDLKRAHKVLQESLKCNHNNWKVWENYMVVSVSTDNFEDVLTAYERLSELKDRFLDLEVLDIVVNAILQGKLDAKGLSAERLRKKASNLLAHQCIKNGSQPQIWELAALLATEPLQKAQKLVKAYNSHTNKEFGWASKQINSHKALQLCCELCQVSLEAITKHAEDISEAMITSQLNSARLASQACIRAIENSQQKWEENESLLEELKKLHTTVVEKIAERTNCVIK